MKYESQAFEFHVRSQLEKGGSDMSTLCGLTLASVAGGSDGPTIDAQSNSVERPASRPCTSCDSTAPSTLALKSHKADAMTAFAWHEPLPGTQLTGPTFSEPQTGVVVKTGSRLAAQLVASINSMIGDGS
jgi:hypothetical protein